MINLKLAACLIVVYAITHLGGCVSVDSNPNSDQVSGFKADSKAAFILTKQNVSKTLEIPAELFSDERTEVRAKIEAFVSQVMVDIGDRVRKGATLAVLEAPETNAQYAEAVARQQEAIARLITSTDKYNRLKIAATHKGAIADSELVSARNQVQVDSAVFNSLQSSTEMYRQLQNYLVIRAPFSGLITNRKVDPGDLVGSRLGTDPLFVLEKPDQLRLRVPVPETFVSAIPADQNISFQVDAMVQQSFQARLSRKSGRIDPDTRSEIWEYLYDNSSGALKPGMYSIAALTLNRAQPAFVVPHSAIATTLENRFVIRLKHGKVEWIDVHQGITMNDGIEIFGSLAEGDTILKRGTEEIRQGTELKIMLE
ncbi:MAG: efflux RND transporter periplasmic adaptor subunit [Saprospiraceae bacterium]|nr:efflux RND transporter periplasmic adaptor subunit [Saprospiraceae bacterium]